MDVRVVIDIGSNAIRYVAFDGPPRAPLPLYNEKWSVEFGAAVAQTGRLDEAAMNAALAALRRFNLLARSMHAVELHVVATAAVRDAANGGEFIARVQDAGLPIRLLSGDDEAEAAGMGVLCDTPNADGYVADLGGGSLELVRVHDGGCGARISLPLGTGRLAAAGFAKASDLARHIAAAIDEAAGFAIEPGKQLFLVGGAWRALMRVDQHFSGFPLPIVSHYCITPDRLAALTAAVQDIDAVRALRLVPSARVASLPDAVRMVDALARLLEPAAIIASAQGIREGLLYQALEPATRTEDPLIALARFEGQRRSRFGLDGDALARWIAPLFDDEDLGAQRLRHAACLIADIGWAAHPELRADYAACSVLDFNWLGLDGADRVMIARAIHVVHGGTAASWPGPAGLVSPEQDRLSTLWGLAIRVAFRLDGGTGALLRSTRLVVDAKTVALHVAGRFAGLASVERRLKRLADAMNRKAELVYRPN